MMHDLMKNPMIFEDAYVPKKLLHREKEVDQICLVLNRGVGNLAIYGSTGTGKTASIQFALRKIPVPHVYIPCSMRVTLKTIVAEIASIQKIKYDRRRDTTGFLIDAVNQWEGFLILDDIDRIRWSEACDILKIRDMLPNTNIIFVTNKMNYLMEVEEHCDREILHRLGVTQLFLKPYTAPQVADILLSRCQGGLAEGSYATNDIHAFSCLVKQKTDGDIRAAIQALKLAANDASLKMDGNNIIFDDMSKALETVTAQRYNEIISNLSDHEKILLFIILKWKGRTFTWYKKAYLQSIRETLEEPLHPSNIWRAFSRLSSLMLIHPEDKEKKTCWYPAISEKLIGEILTLLQEECIWLRG